MIVKSDDTTPVLDKVIKDLDTMGKNLLRVEVVDEELIEDNIDEVKLINDRYKDVGI